MLKLIQEAETRPKNFTGCMEHEDGSKSWYQEGKLHRLDGPAIEDSDGYKAWWIKGKQFTEEEFIKKTSSLNEKTVEIDGKKYKLTLIS